MCLSLEVMKALCLSEYCRVCMYFWERAFCCDVNQMAIMITLKSHTWQSPS